MQGLIGANGLQIRAAIAAMPYRHQKKGFGKKEAAMDAAKQAASGKFAASAPPKLH